ncbi:MAG TPA: (2Fe-2S)-binding protein [Cytophagales bacterium]|nr:(2Fe-2S)-binding protein [Cytophagales bacterium]HAA23497.1 (2Fe-2S)-binding protein [Cytophagales bacterium]HAP61167.1 (2Fe-2S)-binding protein [Cytophagales bacterium]
MENEVVLKVWVGEEEISLEVPIGSNLREVLVAGGLSPYTRWTRRLNCGGRGLCATCGVWIEENEPAPNHWHDRLAKRYGYSRLSCQIRVESAMTIRLDTEKQIWGKPRR